MIATFNNAVVGDKIWHFKHGWGVIHSNFEKNIRPITVVFPEQELKRSFMYSGKYSYSEINQSIFWDEVKIVAPNKPLPKLEIDTKVMVWSNLTYKMKAYFSHFDSQQRICVFPLGRTSWSNDSNVETWDNWRLADE